MSEGLQLVRNIVQGFKADLCFRAGMRRAFERVGLAPTGATKSFVQYHSHATGPTSLRMWDASFYVAEDREQATNTFFVPTTLTDDSAVESRSGAEPAEELEELPEPAEGLEERGEVPVVEAQV